MRVIHCRIDCEVQFNDGHTEFRSLDYINDFVDIPEVNKEFAKDYVMSQLENVNSVEIIDVLYINNDK